MKTEVITVAGTDYKVSDLTKEFGALNVIACDGGYVTNRDPVTDKWVIGNELRYAFLDLMDGITQRVLSEVKVQGIQNARLVPLTEVNV